MKGAFDRGYYLFRRAVRNPRRVYSSEHLQPGREGESWFCFVPPIVSDGILREGIIPCRGRVNIFTVCSYRIIKKDIDETLENLDGIYGLASQWMVNNTPKEHSLNFIGVSLGNTLMFRLIGELGERTGRVKEIYSVVGGSRLGSCARESLLTRDVAGKSGLSEAEYDKRLEKYNPINYTGKLFGRTKAYYGGKDLLIPSKYGRELAESLLQKESRYLHYYPNLGHCMSMFVAGREMKRVRRFLNNI